LKEENKNRYGNKREILKDRKKETNLRWIP
jgi:hypothetical protein